MAKLKTLPSLAIIDGFREKVDFYIYHPTCDPENRGPGIPVARKWPRSPGHLRAQAVMDQWAAFAYTASAWNLMSEEVQAAYRALSVGSGLSGRDLFSRSYLKGLYRYEHTAEDIVPITLYTARAHKAIAAQTIPSGIHTKVTFDTEDWDPDNCFDLPNDKFIVPEAGKYLCNLVIRFNSPIANKNYEAGIKKNGNWYAYHAGHSSTTSSLNRVLTTVVDCAIDDYLEAFAYQNSGAGDDIAVGSFRTFFEIHRLS